MKWIVVGKTGFTIHLSEQLREIGQATDFISDKSNPFDSFKWEKFVEEETCVVIDSDNLGLDSVLSSVTHLEEKLPEANFMLVTSNSNHQEIFSELDIGVSYNKNELTVESFLKNETE